MLDTKQFLSAFEDIEKDSGIPQAVTINALKEAFESIFKKKNYEDTRVDVNIDIEKGDISIYVIKKVVSEVIDDAIEIDLEDAKEIDPNINIGDDCRIKNEIEDFTKADAIKFKSIFKQKIKEAEKAAIYAAYSDKAGELISGTVEKVEPRYTIINIGKTSVNLSNQHKIGDETFTVGQTVKVYLSQVNSSTGGPLIQVSRADVGFLKRLFEEEISEIYDGTVTIKSVSRKAGERSKISVYSSDPNVDPIGACIGTGGAKIQKICSQLGKEKIDVVQYYDYPGAFIAEALKPAQVIGVKVNEEEKTAIAVVRNDDLRVAIGKRGINASLAVELTKYKIDIKEEDDALAAGIEFEPLDLLISKAQARRYAIKNDELKKARAVQEEIKAKQAAEETYDEEYFDEEEIETVEDTPVTVTDETPVEDVVEDVPEVEEVEEEVKVEYNPVRMQPSFSLSDFEKQIEEEKKKKSQPARKKAVKVEETKEEKVVEPKKDIREGYMPIYTPEEEEEFEDEEDDLSKYDDDRFDDYDDDSLYE